MPTRQKEPKNPLSGKPQETPEERDERISVSGHMNCTTSGHVKMYHL